MMARMQRTIQRRLGVHRPASSDVERSARAHGTVADDALASGVSGAISFEPSLFDLSPEQTLRPPVHRLAVPRELRTDRRLARSRPHERAR